MAKRRVCAHCGHSNPIDATECDNCAVLFRDAKPEERKKFAGHDSNPNDPVCQSCGGVASIYPGVLRGGGKGYCSACYRRMRSGGFDGVTEHGSQTAKDLRDIIKAAAERIEKKRRAA